MTTSACSIQYILIGAFIRSQLVQTPSARQRFMVEHDPPMTADNWPAFLYENSKANLDHLAEGLMHSDIMVRVRQT
jgi:hypothetical protein